MRSESKLSAIMETDNDCSRGGHAASNNADDAGSGSLVSFVGARTLSPIVPRNRFSLNQERTYSDGSINAKTVIPHLITVDLWSTDPTTVITAFEELGHLCHPDGVDAIQNRRLVHSTGGHLAYAVIMKKWNYHGDIQFRGICAFGVASMEDKFCTAAVQVGALEAIVVAMKNFPDDEYIQLSGCGALVVLSAKKQSNAEHLVLDLSAHKAVIATIKAYPNNYNLQGIACELLLSLAEHPHLKGPIVKAGGLRTLGYVVEANTRIYAKGTSVKDQGDETAVQTIARKAMQYLLQR